MSNKFDTLVKQLQSIQPDEGVFLNIELVESCGISVEKKEDEYSTSPVSVEKKWGFSSLVGGRVSFGISRSVSFPRSVWECSR